LAWLADKISVVAITGRSVTDARRILGLESLVYSGNHGAEWLDRGAKYVEPSAQRYVTRIHELALRATRELEIEQLFVEDKGPTLSIHYRNAPNPSIARDVIFDFLATAASEMNVQEGKMVAEVRPPLPLSKGTSVQSFVRQHGLRAMLVIGDDATDAEAFDAARELRSSEGVVSMNIAVIATDSPAALMASADYAIDGTRGVQRLLDWLKKNL
jgi:trehalose 6-phosphate phosphatase